MRSPHSLSARKSVKFDGIGLLDVEDRDVAKEPEYRVWVDALSRCYPPNWEREKLRSYAGTTIGESFRQYSDFYAWFRPRYFAGCNLDKDIKERGNKTYSAETCLVVSARTNKAFQLKRRDGLLPHGVKARPGGKFAATVFNLDGTYSARTFSSPNEAHRHWQRSKADLLIHLSESESEEASGFIVFRAMLLRADAEQTRFTMGCL